MKKITIVLDGVADRPNQKLGGRTPLEYARTPHLDALARKSVAGSVKTIPDGMEVGSAVGNLSMLGFDPSGYRGRAVIEAAGLHMPVEEDDLYIRVNLVTFEGGGFETSKIKSYSAYDISTEAAGPVAEALKKAVYTGEYDLHYCGSFRNILIVKGGKKLYPLDLAPAHDIIGQPIAQFIRTEGPEAPFFDLMKKSYEFLQTQPGGANGVWFWGASIVPEIQGETKGRVALSETLLMDGITEITGIPNIGTKREGRSYPDFLAEKLQKSIRAAKEYDTVYVHLQETDDLSHELQPLEKAQAVEAFDALFLPRFLESLEGEYTVKLAADHFTYSDTGAHGGDPVPFLYYHSKNPQNREGRFTEAECARAGVILSAAELAGL